MSKIRCSVKCDTSEFLATEREDLIINRRKLDVTEERNEWKRRDKYMITR